MRFALRHPKPYPNPPAPSSPSSPSSPSERCWWGAERDLRVALAWNDATVASPYAPAPETVLNGSADIDLNIHAYRKYSPTDYILMAVSESVDNTYEVLDMKVDPGATCDIRVRANNIKPADWTHFGIAWDTRH